jgi:tRNA threonylcarbamoyladenosine biosynthesis protein TsaB
VKGLAYATGKLLVGVPTLEALALQAVRNELVQEDEYIVPMIDARRDEIYMAVYRRSGNSIKEVLPSQALRLKDVAMLMPAKGSLVLMGDGVNKFQGYAVKADGMNVSRLVVPSSAMRSCTAASIGLLGEIRLQRSEGTNGATLEPLYVKEFYTTATMPQPQVIS